MTDREKIEQAIGLIYQVQVKRLTDGGYMQEILDALEIGRRSTLDGWERASKCRQ